MKLLKKSLFSAIFFILITTNVSASNPSEFISDLSLKTSEILSSKITDDEKIVKLKKIGESSVDINGVGLYTLGKYRKTLTENQKAEYKKLFKDYFLKSFSGRLVSYKDAKIIVINEEVKNEKYTIVYSKLLGNSDRPEVKIDWRVYTKDTNNPLIRDLIIEGLSLARTQKEEFTSILNSNEGDINVLFKTLEKFSQN